MALLTAQALASVRRRHPATARRWIADARRDTSGAAFPVVEVTVTGGNGARITAPALVVPDEVVAMWRREAQAV